MRNQRKVNREANDMQATYERLQYLREVRDYNKSELSFWLSVKEPEFKLIKWQNVVVFRKNAKIAEEKIACLSLK